jgi:hypothetical protein
MITRIWATLRTIYLLIIVAYALWAMPWVALSVPRTFDEQYARCAGAIIPLQRAVWMAIAWIALETLVGWMTVARAGRTARKALASPAEPGPKA